MAVTPLRRAEGKLRLLLVLPPGDLPQWLGEALTGLAVSAAWSIQVRRAAPQADPAPRSGTIDRWWLHHIPSLHRWNGPCSTIDALLSWGGDDLAPDVTLLLDPRSLQGSPLPPGSKADRAGDLRQVVATTVGAASSEQRHDGDLVEPAADTVTWLLCDYEGRALSPVYPLLEDICAGRGLQLQLLARDQGGVAWSPLSRLHRASSALYPQGLTRLAPAVRDLVEQALLGHEAARLAGRRPSARAPDSGSFPVAPLPMASAWCQGSIALWRGLGGVWRTWLVRQRSVWLSEYWRVGVIDAPIASLLEGRAPLPATRWITPASRFGYWADPFGLPGNPRRLTCELFDERTGVGHLEVLELDTDGEVASRTRLAVGGGRHVSFPNVFEIEGRRLGLAESVATRECVLHEVDEHGAWRPAHVLLHDVAAADPALFEWQGRYWLAFTDADLGDMDNLCLYHAERLDGVWQAHGCNPVKIDVRSARMAGGLFWHAGELYRPAQDCLRTYGAAVVLHRIVRLTPETFEEVAVRRLDPDPQGECPDGLHTLTAWGERTLIDGKRHGINMLAVWRKLRRRSTGGRRPFALSVLPDHASHRRLMLYIPDLRMGGGEKSMLQLAAGLAEAGLTVELVVHDMQTSELAVPPGVQVTSLQTRGTATALFGLVRRVRASRPHWLLTAFPHTNIAAVLALLLARSTARCVITEHAPLSRQIRQQGAWRYRILPPLVRWAYRRAHAVVAVSAGVRDDLQSLIGTGVAPEVIHNPVLPANLDAEMSRLPDHPWLLDASLQVVLSVSRLSPEKDLPALLRVFATIHRARPASRLLMVGEGPDRPRLEALIAELGLEGAVQLPGATQFPLRWMRRAAVLALPSLYEGFGNVLIEALACGTPVVSTDCPVGPRELLEGGRLGALVPPGDEAALGAAINAALARGRVLPAGAQEAARRYTSAASCRAYLRLLEALYPTDSTAC